MGNVGIVEGGVWDTENHYSGGLWLCDLLNTIESAFDSISGGRRKEREIQRSAVRQDSGASCQIIHAPPVIRMQLLHLWRGPCDSLIRVTDVCEVDRRLLVA